MVTNDPQPDPRTKLNLDEGIESYNFLWRVHSHTSESIRFADSKATLLLGVGWGVLSAELAKTHDAIKNWGASGLSLLGLAAIASMVLLTLSTVTASWVIAPRLGGSQSRGLIYWGNVRQHESAEEYSRAFDGKKLSDLRASVAKNLFEISQIAENKFRWLALATWLGLLGGLLAVPVIAMF
jgi:hypothetical protein